MKKKSIFVKHVAENARDAKSKKTLFALATFLSQ